MRRTIREIRSRGDPAFRPAYALLRRAFTKAEMLPLADWSNALGERAQALWTDVNWHLLVAEEAGRVLGAATGSYLGNVNVGVIGYIAVRANARTAGLGPRMRRALLSRFEADARRTGRDGLEALVGEVRAENPWLRHLVRRHGAIALDFPYFQPSLKGTEPAVPLVLYYQPLRTPRTFITAAELRRLLYTMWRRAYRIPQPLRDPVFRRMLRALEGRRRVGQRGEAKKRR